jgi:hypothetical protein
MDPFRFGELGDSETSMASLRAYMAPEQTGGLSRSVR